jgi:hypothetical protein
MLPRRWFQFRIATLFVVVTVIAVGLAIGPDLYGWWNVTSLSNSDVKVDGNFIGLQVSIQSRASHAVRYCGKRAYPYLIEALRDRNRFAAAHVLLTELQRDGHIRNDSHGNKLQVTLHGDGSVDFHPEQMDRIADMWEERLSIKRR